MENGPELIYKSSTKNTLREERIAMLRKGEFSTGAVSGIGIHEPRAEEVGVSNYAFADSVFDGRMHTLTGRDAIRAIGDPILSGSVEEVRGLTPMMNRSVPWLGDKTLQQAIADGAFKDVLAAYQSGIKMDGNSYIDGVNTLWDAYRIDLTIRKAMRPTVYEYLYSVMDTPDADQVMNTRELYEYAFEFTEVSGTGEAVEQGEARGGEYDTMTQKIYATGFTHDLLKALFDRTLDMTRVNDGVTLAESAIKDDLALAPIFAFTYSGVSGSQTAADTTGSTKEEKLYNTISKAMDDIRLRRDPATLRLLNPMGCQIIASPADAKHIAQVAAGYMGVEQNVKNRPRIDEIGRVIGYEGERIQGVTKLKTYTDVPTGKAYVVIPNRRMMIAVKRTLQLNINRNPDPATLAQSKQAWWFCWAIYNAGIGNFVQEITLPTWWS